MKYIIWLILVLDISLNANIQIDPLLNKNIIIIFDDSGSMKSGITNSRISRAKDATNSVINSLSEDNNLGIYALNSGYIFKLQHLTNEKKSIALDKVNKLYPDGGTNITSAIKHARISLLQQKKQQAGYGSYIIIIVTDGIADNKVHMLKEVDKSIEKKIAIKTIGLDIKTHALMDVTEFTKASSTKQLIDAINRAINSEIEINSNFKPQDF
jgi:uncharacterized protein with von Willebrand factor type A (vWA) domain